MKYCTTLLLFLLNGLFFPLLASEGDFENRLRDASIAGDQQRIAAICQEWYASGQYSAGTLNWNYNALMSVEENALIFTQQESDTYPALMLQNALQVRPDVKVFSLQLLENQQYRNAVIRTQNLNWIAVDCSSQVFWTQLLAPGHAETLQPLYFGIMTDKNLLRTDREKLYLTGLALKWSAEPFDNVAVLRQNFENRFLTDYLEFNVQPESDPATVARLNLNYIPALLLLHRHYTTAGETAKADRLQSLALGIARAGGKEAEVRAFFVPENPPTAIVSGITPKLLDKSMRKVGARLYAAETELTNLQYELFLQDLLENKDFDQLNLCRTTATDWRALLPEKYRGLSDQQLFRTGGNPDNPGNPVQNISHDAALRYCAWITQVYNNSPEKKRFKKVLFRLPTAEEWEIAATGGLKPMPYATPGGGAATEGAAVNTPQSVPYPWGGYFVQNSKGCFLANYNTLDPCSECPAQSADSNDGAFFTVPAESYFPNEFGLYNVSGNVAEMVQEFGITKGGSWRDDPYFGQITPRQTYTQPAPSIGFRVFMEVIEE